MMHILCSYIKTISEMEEKEEGGRVKSNIQEVCNSSRSIAAVVFLLKEKPIKMTD